ncbi:MAG: GNAT family N-acetyltransferase [Legionella sp.]|nr:MAG: GNAT family N-acetyltransferase [Legionella sp.]PJE00101.1 MAG: GNAT family N-acetyltransferase [Legionella sp.]
MTESVKIIYEKNPSSDEIQILTDGITQYAKLEKGQPPIESFAFFVCNEANQILGGCNGSIYYGCLYIDQLWIDESLRNKKIGTQLMQSAEKLGKEKGCLFSTVNTMDWEALGFYQRLGYEIEHQRFGYFSDSILFFMKKDFIPQ